MNLLFFYKIDEYFFAELSWRRAVKPASMAVVPPRRPPLFPPRGKFLQQPMNMITELERYSLPHSHKGRRAPGVRLGLRHSQSRGPPSRVFSKFPESVSWACNVNTIRFRRCFLVWRDDGCVHHNRGIDRCIENDSSNDLP